MYSHRGSLGPVDLAFTDRYGGVSAPPYDELDLALVGGGSTDDPAALTENLRRVVDDFAPGLPVADMHQVHGADVAVVDGPHDDVRPHVDGLVTTRRGLVLLVRVADCVPVVLADPERGVVGVAHAGRPGVLRGIVPAVVAAMRDLGARDLTAWVGPHVCGGCYEVPAAMQDEVVAAEPATRATTTWGTPALDLGAGVRDQLARLGVTAVDLSRCTRESDDLYSYRRDGAHSGRMAGLVVLRNAA